MNPIESVGLVVLLEEVATCLSRCARTPTPGKRLRDIEERCVQAAELFQTPYEGSLSEAAQNWSDSFAAYSRLQCAACALIEDIGWQWARASAENYEDEWLKWIGSMRDAAHELFQSTRELAVSVAGCAAAQAAKWHAVDVTLANRFYAVRAACVSMEFTLNVRLIGDAATSGGRQ